MKREQQSLGGAGPRRSLAVGGMVIVLGVLSMSGSTPVVIAGSRIAGLPPRCASYVGAAAETSPEGDPARPPAPLAKRYPRVDLPGTRLRLNEVDLLQSLQQVRAFKPVQTFELPSSGVVAFIRSDGEVAVDAAAVDELMHVHLRLASKHTAPLLLARMQCYADTILRDRAFAGAVVNIYVPSDPAMCLRALRLVKRAPDTTWRQSCHWGGATPPVHFSTYVADIRMQQFHVLVAPGILDWDNARPSRRMAMLLRHESDHLWDWMMGQRYDALSNERRARLGDDLVADYYRTLGIPLPTPFVFELDPPGVAADGRAFD